MLSLYLFHTYCIHRENIHINIHIIALFNCLKTVFLLSVIDRCEPFGTDQSTMLKSRVGALLVRPCSNVTLLSNHDNKELKEDVDGCVEVGGSRVDTRSVQLPYMLRSLDFCV